MTAFNDRSPSSVVNLRIIPSQMKVRDLALETEVLPLTETKRKPAENKPISSTNVTLVLLIAAWYTSSVVCTNTSKSLNLPWELLTFCQMVISSLCAVCGIRFFRLDGQGLVKPFPQPEARAVTVLLSLVFCAGFVTLNASLSFMHVSAVMTLRATEPVATWLLSLGLILDETTPTSAVASLLIIVLGAGMSAFSKGSQISTEGILLVLLCNVCFALRTIITKRLKAQFVDVDNFNLFLELCLLGSMWQGIVLLFSNIAYHHQDINFAILFLNGVSFYLYLQLSWVVMSKIGAVTHSVCNSLRRPVICMAGWIAFGGATTEGAIGVTIATAGTLCYARAKRK